MKVRFQRSNGARLALPFSFLIVGFLALSTDASAQAIYRCQEGGKTVYGDKPCAVERAPAATSEIGHVEGRVANTSNATLTALDYSTPYGEWRGQVQLQATAQGQRLPQAHSVAPMTVMIDGQGKVTGASKDNGCRVLGVASPGLMPQILNLDVSFASCQYASYNRRYSGYLALYPKDKTAQLSLNSFDSRPGASAIYDARGTMRR